MSVTNIAMDSTILDGAASSAGPAVAQPGRCGQKGEHPCRQDPHGEYLRGIPARRDAVNPNNTQGAN